MIRRDLLAFAAVAAPLLLRPFGVRAQQAKVPTLGVLVVGKPDPAPTLRRFREELRKLGYVEGRNLRIEVRSAEGDAKRLPQLAAELVRERVDVIGAWMTPSVLAAKHATNEIPIVMIGVADPVGTGIVASLAQPGGNVTGIAGLTAELAGKHVQLFKEALPGLGRVAALANAPDPFSKTFVERIRVAAASEAVEFVPVTVTAAAELDTSFRTMLKDKIGAVIVQPSLPLKQVAELGLRYRLPTGCPLIGFAQYGGLLGYWADTSSNQRQAASLVDKILKGAKPADLPVEQPTRFELTINLKTAKVLGLTMPASLLARADEVIE